MYLYFVGIAATSFTDNFHLQPLAHLVPLADHQKLFVFSKISYFYHIRTATMQNSTSGRNTYGQRGQTESGLS